jgi:hypothetical protein
VCTLCLFWVGYYETLPLRGQRRQDVVTGLEQCVSTGGSRVLLKGYPRIE